MATIDATKGQETYRGDAFILPAMLKELKKDFDELLEESKKFNPIEAHPNADPRVTYLNTFGMRLHTQRNLIVFIASATVEAAANFMLVKLTDSDAFAFLERSTPIEKWVTIPKLLIPGYKLQKSGEVYYHLKELNKRRNAITHPKMEVMIDDEVIHRGNLPKLSGDENRLHLHFCDLPDKLIDNLKKYDQEQAMHLKVMFGMRWYE